MTVTQAMCSVGSAFLAVLDLFHLSCPDAKANRDRTHVGGPGQ